MKLKDEIKKYHHVTLPNISTTAISNYSVLEELVLQALTLSTSIKQLEMTNSTLPASIWEYLGQQLSQCEQLSEIDLHRMKHIPVQFCKTPSTTTSLRRVNLEHCKMSFDVSHILLSSLRHCKHLEEINLSDNTLTGCIRALLAPTIVFPNIKILNLSCTKLNREDVTNLRQIITSTKTPKLKELNFSGNILSQILTKEFLLPSLESLNLKNTSLNRDDMQCVCESVRCGHLPNLKHLKLLSLAADITLLDVSTFRSLETFHIYWYEVSREDILNLSSAISRGTFSRKSKLELRHSNLNDLRDEVKNLIESLRSVANRRHKIILELYGNDISSEYWKAMQLLRLRSLYINFRVYHYYRDSNCINLEMHF